MTHPHNDSRIEKVRGYRTARDFQEEKIEMNWESIKDVIKEKTDSID